MFQKLVAVFGVAFLLCSCLCIRSEALQTQEVHAQASYASTAPVIDGEIDDIWDTTERLWSYGDYNQATGQAYGSARLLWDEGNLYLLDRKSVV